jgi:hypothetical protein
MTKYEIKTDSFEFSFGKYKASIPSASEDQIFEWYMEGMANDAKTRESFDTLEEAQAEFKKYYANYGSTRAVAGWTNWLLCGELAWIEENEYDDDGEFIQGGGFYDVSAAPYEKEEEVDE